MPGCGGNGGTGAFLGMTTTGTGGVIICGLGGAGTYTLCVRGAGTTTVRVLYDGCL